MTLTPLQRQDGADTRPARRPSATTIAVAALLLVTGAVGWLAAFALTLDKLAITVDADATLECNVSLLVQCGRNLQSWQGSLLGFPNPLIGLGGFVAPMAVGAALLAGARFDRWFLIAFNVGVAGAMGLVIWLMSQSIFVLGTLCPWCMLTWSMVIPLFLATTAWVASLGGYGRSAVRAGRGLLSFLVPATLAAYLAVAAVAQLRLDWIGTVF